MYRFGAQALPVLAAPVVTNAGTITATNLGNPDGEEYSVTGFMYTGTGTVTYQWNFDGTPIGGATSATYTTSKATASAKALSRTTTVTNDAGSDDGTTAGQLLSWAPQTWVENSGSAYMVYDGGFGSNSEFYELAFYWRDQSTSSTRNWYNVRDTRVQIRTGSSPNSGTLVITLRDSSATVLVDWASDAGINGSGDWIYHIAVSLTGTPSMVVSRCQITNNIAGAWETVAGTFATGPTNGTINHARNASGNDQFALASTGGTNLASVETGYLWIGQGAPHARTAFADANGIVIDPNTVTSPVGLFYGPAASFTTNHGSGGDFTVGAGSFTDT